MDQNSIIHPCPFSKNYSISAEQAWSLLKIFFAYRFVLVNLFVILFFSAFSPSLLGSYDKQLYIAVSRFYWLFTMISVPFVFWRLVGYISQAQIFIFSDIIFITLIMHACGGVNSGFGMLLAISIAAGGMLIGGRCALLFAALASLSVLTEQVYALQVHAFQETAFAYSGMLGASFFTIAFLSNVMAKRTEQSDLLASERQQTISRLEGLNRYIIQHLQSGIIIINQQQQIQLSNEAVLRLPVVKKKPTTLVDVSSRLPQAFAAWRTDSRKDRIIIQLDNGSKIQARFSLLDMQPEALYMIIFEDVALYNQRLQQNKLASLGRLTASIAHEIRNPLSAISHAGQLLSEATDLSPQDRRLTEIIQNHSQRVNHIINDILNLSRRNPSRKDKLLLNEWLPEFIDRMIAEQSYPKHCFNLKISSDALNVLMDTGHLRQILNNLCSNALKYGCEENESILLQTEMIQGLPCINIIDNGPCLDTEVRDHLFEPFFTTSASGTGLGLYISRELAELNQAKLSYACKQNKNCFSLCLPNADQAVIEL